MEKSELPATQEWEQFTSRGNNETRTLSMKQSEFRQIQVKYLLWRCVCVCVCVCDGVCKRTSCCELGYPGQSAERKSDAKCIDVYNRGVALQCSNCSQKQLSTAK